VDLTLCLLHPAPALNTTKIIDMANPCHIPNHLLPTKRITCEHDVTISDFLRDSHTMMALSKINFLQCLIKSKVERQPFTITRRSVVLGAFAQFHNATITFAMSTRLSVLMEQLGSHWADFYVT
jgi:hypothetical protein